MITGLPPAPAIVKAADAAWNAYATSCRLRAGAVERQLTYQLARRAEQRLWVAMGLQCAKLDHGANT